jgi:hypothetical protein
LSLFCVDTGSGTHRVLSRCSFRIADQPPTTPPINCLRYLHAECPERVRYVFCARDRPSDKPRMARLRVSHLLRIRANTTESETRWFPRKPTWRVDSDDRVELAN